VDFPGAGPPIIGIATEKSTVSMQLAARNIPVIDADVARHVVRPDTRTLKKIIPTFGPDDSKEDVTFDRPNPSCFEMRSSGENSKPSYTLRCGEQ